MQDPSLSTHVKRQSTRQGSRASCLLALCWRGLLVRRFALGPRHYRGIPRCGSSGVSQERGGRNALASPASFLRSGHPAALAVQCAPYSVVKLLLLPGVRSASALSLAAHALDPGTLLGLARHSGTGARQGSPGLRRQAWKARSLRLSLEPMVARPTRPSPCWTRPSCRCRERLHARSRAPFCVMVEGGGVHPQACQLSWVGGLMLALASRPSGVVLRGARMLFMLGARKLKASLGRPVSP